MRETGLMMEGVYAKNYRNALGVKNKLYRAVWGFARILFFRFSPAPFFFWRRALLRVFGASMGKGAKVYPSCRIWAPFNLTMGDHSCLADGVDCYSVGRIEIGANTTVSQRAFLCTATHDIRDPLIPLVVRPIAVGSSAWIAAEAFVGPGITIGEGAVALARAVVVKDVEPWTIVAGNPARPMGKRILELRP